MNAFREGLLRDAVATYDEVARRNPGGGSLGLGQSLNNQALVEFLLGEFPKALATQIRGEEVLATLRPSYDARLALADAKKQLGVLYHYNGKHAEGVAKTREAVALYQRPRQGAARGSTRPVPTGAGDGELGQLREGARSQHRDHPLPRGPR